MKNNFRLLVVALGIIAATPALAQKDNVGIGTTKPDQSAALDVSSSNKGLLMPRMSLQQRSAIQNPAQGLVIYQTDFLSGFYFYDGKDWKPMSSETKVSSVADANNWGLDGNSTVVGKFVGTTNNVPLEFKVAGEQVGHLSYSYGSVFFGVNAGGSKIKLNNVAIGRNALSTNNGDYNVGLGAFSLENNTIGTQNLGIGFKALKANTEGGYNVAIGGNSLLANTLGGSNVALGYFALGSNISGELNIGMGTDALAFNSTGSNNLGIGERALRKHQTGDGNIGIGSQALHENLTGVKNIAIGFQAGLTELGSNKLYVANSATDLPLIYGDFSAKFISIGDVGVTGDPVATAAKRNNLSAQYGLLVQKGILTEKIKVATMSTTDWADYVFENDYKRMSLEEVEQFVKENKHLPNVPTTVEMMASGSDLIKTDAKLLEKIEELTLYMIELNKEIKALKAENAKLRK